MSASEKRQGRPPRIVGETRDRIIALREAGVPARKIARDLGISYGSVDWICLMEGVEPPTPHALPARTSGPVVVMRNGSPVRRYLPDEDAQLLRMEGQGLTDSQIGRALGRRPVSVKARLATLAGRDARAEEAAGGARG